MGSPALAWRQLGLGGDTTTLVRDLRLGVEHLLPAGLEVKVASIEKVADYEQPLIVLFK